MAHIACGVRCRCALALYPAHHAVTDPLSRDAAEVSHTQEEARQRTLELEGLVDLHVARLESAVGRSAELLADFGLVPVRVGSTTRISTAPEVG